MAHKYSVDVLVNCLGNWKFDWNYTTETIEEARERAEVWRGSGKIFSIQNMDGTVVEVVK